MSLPLASNYGEAGALDRYGPALGLPRPYSGHNGWGYWGPPPDGPTDAVVVGYSEPSLLRWFSQVTLAGRIDFGMQLENDEQGMPIFICRAIRRPWSAIWPQVRWLGA